MRFPDCVPPAWSTESYHKAFSKFKAGISEEDKAAAFDTTFKLVTPIPGVKNFKAGPPVATTYAQGYGFGELLRRFAVIELIY